MNKIIIIFIKSISIMNVVVSLGVLLISSTILKQAISFSNVAIVVFSVVYAFLLWMTGKRIEMNLSEKAIKPEKPVIVLLILAILMIILQNVCTILFVCNFLRSNSIIVPCMLPMIVFQLIDGIERYIKSRT